VPGDVRRGHRGPFDYLVREELEGHAVHAVAQPGGARAVVEDVAQVAAAAAAVDLRADHEEAAIGRRADGSLDRLIAAGPARAAVELRVRGEERQVAAGAAVRAVAVLLVERARAGAPGAVPAQHPVRPRTQPRPPFPP